MVPDGLDPPIIPWRSAPREFPPVFSCCARHQKLGSASQVPPHQRRIFIGNCYRLQSPRLIHFFTLHNETLNIWSHLLGAVFFAMRGWHWVMTELETPYDEYSAFYAMLVMLLIMASLICMGASALFHWRSCSSLREHRCYLCADRAGILCLFASSFAVGITFGFTCMPRLQRAYLGLFSLLIISMAVTFLIPALHKYQALALKTAMLSVIPACHWLLTVSRSKLAFLTPGLFAMALGYLGGLAFELSKVPERFFPGRCDLVGHSHQLWHVFSLGASSIWLETMCSAYTKIVHDPSLCES